jgi:hypothetical protein
MLYPNYFTRHLIPKYSFLLLVTSVCGYYIDIILIAKAFKF